MMVKNINGLGRLLRGALGVVCFVGAAWSASASVPRTTVLVAFGVLCVFQAAVGM